jgi:hypothetical protein
MYIFESRRHVKTIIIIINKFNNLLPHCGGLGLIPPKAKVPPTNWVYANKLVRGKRGGKARQKAGGTRTKG